MATAFPFGCGQPIPTLYGLVYLTCKNYKTCFIYGAHDFCASHIKYLKLCSTFPKCIERGGTHIAMNT